MASKTEGATHEVSAGRWMKLHGQRCGLSERAGSKIMEYGSEIDMKIFNGGVYLERILAAGFLSLLSFAFVLS